MSNILTLWPLGRICIPTTFQQIPQMFAKIWRKLWPSWENQFIPFECIPSKAVSCKYLMTEYYVVVFCVNVRDFLPRVATLLVPSKIMCLCTHIVLIFPYHVAKEEIWRYHFCQSFIIFIGYRCPAFVNKDIQCLEISVEPSPCLQFLHSSCNGQHNVQFEVIKRGVTWQSQWNFLNPLTKTIDVAVNFHKVHQILMPRTIQLRIIRPVLHHGDDAV